MASRLPGQGQGQPQDSRSRGGAGREEVVHDTVHEMCKDEARHGKGFEGLYNRYFK